MKAMINFSRIKTRLRFELQALKKASRDALPEMIKTLTNGLTFLIYAFFISVGLVLGFFFTVGLIRG
ncbi:hypothetical protein DSF30_06565 [Salmonella enterica subsp. enterica serovar Oranienburg]|uniref:Uncharacterized protein n=1 Tax=Salmonella enterica TaxID=28901 RepID=A0A633DCI8_SALER|nr:hypothetical protein [Salmonella enterica]EBQ9987933.1 hypothetical protein [Salmonella enterica subsp. enterica serovar Oranienburg]EBU8699420.1 hypothetical protein [Salmonella enterica subsp. enterica serovar Kokomlemle]EBW2603729.1 hypothetical protein [Salmonella enterica subsp. enterica serovar Poano]EBE9327966.1 hypothetical protein [Salmonella enterica]